MGFDPNDENSHRRELADILSALISGGEVNAEKLNEAIESLQREREIARARSIREQNDMKNLRMMREIKKRRERTKRIESVKSRELPEGFINPYLFDDSVAMMRTGDVFRALDLSIMHRGCVDILYISALTDIGPGEVIDSLGDEIYQDPDKWQETFYLGWTAAREYLSGDLHAKLVRAKKAENVYSGLFERNIKAIEKAMPPRPDRSDIYVTLGSPWVPADIIDDFIRALLGEPDHSCMKSSGRTRHDLSTGSWEIPDKNRYNHSRKVANVYGTVRMEALQIIEKTLNMRTVVVYDDVISFASASGTRRVINRSETLLAQEKQKVILKQFSHWIFSDPERANRLSNIFYARYCSFRRPSWKGTHLSFQGFTGILYDYQKSAAERIIRNRNTLLAHDVGAGKTYVMLTAAMELRHTGISKKNVFIVPNNITSQWKNIFSELYSSGHMLVVDPQSFVPSERISVLEKIRDCDYDAIVIAYSCFEMIPISAGYRLSIIEAERAKMNGFYNGKGDIGSKLLTKSKNLAKESDRIKSEGDSGFSGVCFDQLGITGLFVDEAHNFKNLPIDTKTDRVLGINTKGSAKCSDMLEKVRIVQELPEGRVVFATGTPLTNSITDAFVIQTYLQPDVLRTSGLEAFDSWIGMFAEKTSEFEIDVDTRNYRMATRFSKFRNLYALTAMLSLVSDFHSADATAGIPDFDGYTDFVVRKTPEFEDYLALISKRADDVRGGLVSRVEDNMLKITTDGRKAALDLRLALPGAPFSEESKVVKCADNVCRIWKDTAAFKGTQLVFCDTSVPKDSFNLYDELKRLLVMRGIPEREIQFVHTASTDRAREKLFASVCSGDVRVLLGSTFKLGLGVNVQERLVALHHLDVPWRPSDMTQREGRILRQGNTNEKVYICRYITAGSFDAYSWQLLETKQKFISDLLSGSLDSGSGDDIENTVLDYAEVKALAIGNPLIKKRVETANALSRAMTLRRRAEEMRLENVNELALLPDKISNQRHICMLCEKDIRESGIADARDSSAGGKAAAEARRTARQKLEAAVRHDNDSQQDVFVMDYRGFRIFVPSGMRRDRPYVKLSGNGVYYTGLGDNETGNLVRIDNTIDALSQTLVRFRESLDSLLAKKEQIESELAAYRDTADEIAELRAELEKIDSKLGVNV